MEEVLQELRVTPAELVELLKQTSELEIKKGQKLVVRSLDSNDFFKIIGSSSPVERFKAFTQMMERYPICFRCSGSLSLGEFDAGEFSWTLYPGNSGQFTIRVRPEIVALTLEEVVRALLVVPRGRGIALKPGQDFLLKGLSSDEMLDYYRFCKDHTDPVKREEEQDLLFLRGCSLLKTENARLKFFGSSTVRVDRSIDLGAGGMFFKPIGDAEHLKPSLVLALI